MTTANDRLADVLQISVGGEPPSEGDTAQAADPIAEVLVPALREHQAQWISFPVAEFQDAVGRAFSVADLKVAVGQHLMGTRSGPQVEVVREGEPPGGIFWIRFTTLSDRIKPPRGAGTSRPEASSK